jgi:hypothetical protein
VLDRLVQRLETASRRLNRAAEDATYRIEALEQRLLDAEPGITVWGATLLTEQSVHQKDGTSATEPAERVVSLGFTKVNNDEWGIAVRDVSTGKHGQILSEEQTLLREAERNVRILALPHLEALTELVVETVEAQAAALQPTPSQTEPIAEEAALAEAQAAGVQN